MSEVSRSSSFDVSFPGGKALTIRESNGSVTMALADGTHMCLVKLDRFVVRALYEEFRVLDDRT